MNYLDLFSGIGGFTLGMEMAGIKIDKHYFSEVDKYATAVYKKHFSGAIELGDVRKIDAKTLGQIDIITGGFPCQDISQAGRQAGIQGVRSGLFYEIIRIIKDCLPRIIVLENVSNLLGINNGADFGAVLTALAEVGYDAEWHSVPASHVGAHHRRDRVWIIAYTNNAGSGTPGCRIESSGTQEGKERKHAQFKSGRYDKNVANTEGDRNRRFKRNSEPKNFSCGKEKRNRIRSITDNIDSLSRKDKNRTKNINQWEIEPDVGRVANGVPARVDRLKCLGNAVVPQVVEFIFKTIVIPILEER